MTNLLTRHPSDNGYRKDGPYEGLSAVDGLIVDGAYLDGSWELCVHVEDVNDVVCIRVRGDVSVGGLMHLIVEAVPLKQSWSDHAIWWPLKNMWLLHTKTSLDQYGVQSDAKLMFRRTHGNLQIVLPSLSTLILHVNYASRVFTVVENICKELCIRHFEELSLMFPIKRDTLKFNQPLPVVRHGTKKTGPLTSIGGSRSEMPSAQTNGVDGAPSATPLNDSNPYPTLPYGSATLTRVKSDISLDGEFVDIGKFADCSQRKSAKMAFADGWLFKPKNVQQKARIDGSWLDSSRSLMEHGVEPPSIQLGEFSTNPHPNPPTLYLRFKYCDFYDINTSYDAIRIHQLYEQARWSLLAGNSECTEDEMVVFAAYQLQAELQNEEAVKSVALMNTGTGCCTLPRYATLGGHHCIGSPADVSDCSMRVSSTRSLGGSLFRMPSLGTISPATTHRHSPLSNPNGSPGFLNEPIREADEIESMLTELEQSCNVSHRSQLSNSARNQSGSMVDGNLPDSPVLQDSIKVFRDKGLLMRRYKELWVIVNSTKLMFYRYAHNTETPLVTYLLRDCLLTLDLCPGNGRFAVKLSLVCDAQSSRASTPVTGGRRSRTREEVWLRFNNAEQYSKWVTAFRLAACGKSLTDREVFDKELQLVREVVENQTSPHVTPVLSPEELNVRLGDLTDFCAEGIIKKTRSKDSLRQKISSTHAGMRDLLLLDAKLRYIKDWQRLNHFGRSYCIVRFDKENKFGLGGSAGSALFSSGPQEDVIAIRQGRIEVVSSTTEATQLAWNFTDLRSWNVNWDTGRVILDFRNGVVSFKPLTANCKTVVELLGGYVFLSQRTPDRNQKIDERLFHKLTGAND